MIYPATDSMKGTEFNSIIVMNYVESVGKVDKERIFGYFSLTFGTYF